MAETMKAQWYQRYGRPEEVLELREVPVPVPGPGEALVRVHTASVQPLDWQLIVGEPRVLRLSFGLRTRRHIPGADMAGTVEAVGPGVTRFVPGDSVFGETGGGCLADLVVAPESNLARKPDDIGFPEAAAIPVAGLTALQGLRDSGRIQAGDHVLVVGASGGVGTYAVQIAKALGAVVTAVCSTRNVETAGALGADRVVDYTREDFAAGGDRYDVIFDGPCTRPVLQMRRLLEADGSYVAIGAATKGRWIAPLPRLARVAAVSALGRRRMTSCMQKCDAADLETMADLMVAGSVTPMIDRNYKLEEAVEALNHIGKGHARGKVVVTI